MEFIIENRAYITQAFLTLQKEFAERVASQAKGKEFGSLSCFVQYYACATILFSIRNSCFWPVPKVDSAFMRLDLGQSTVARAKDEKKLFTIIHRAFGQRRKMLRTSLKDTIPPETLARFFEDFRLDGRIRPEELSLADFVALSNLS